MRVFGLRRSADILKKQRLGLTGLTVTADAHPGARAAVGVYPHPSALRCRAGPRTWTWPRSSAPSSCHQDGCCSVAATIRGVTEITFDFEVRNEA